MSSEMIIALVAAFAAGAAFTYIVVDFFEPEERALERGRVPIIRAVEQPSPIALPRDTREAELDIPTEKEAAVALAKAKDGHWRNLTVKLGQCSKDNLGPGVQCALDASWDGLQGRVTDSIVVGFARTPTGWNALHYF